MSQQTVLPFSVWDDAGLNSFFPDGNEALIDDIASLLDGVRAKPVIYLWGEQGSGKTHLLNGCCLEFQDKGQPCVYLSICPSDEDLDARLDQIDPNSLVCIDDIHNLGGNIKSQEVILTLYEKTVQHGGKVIVSANQSPLHLHLELKDLESRLTSGGVFVLHKLDDEAKVTALKLRAHKRGFELEDKVMSFIMSHYDRDTASLFALLDKIDRASLAEQRKVTVPFIKTFL